MKYRLLIPAIVIFAISNANAQDLMNPTTQFLTKRGYTFPDSTIRNNVSDSLKKWPDTLYYNTSYTSKFLGSITVPFYFSNVEINNASIALSPTVNIGLGYTWFWGDFIFSEDDKIRVSPSIYFGLMASTGIENGLSLKQGGLITGGFVGVTAFTLIFGYDIINRSPSLGAGGRIDFYTISQKFLHVLGRVKELRKHKRIAAQIAAD